VHTMDIKVSQTKISLEGKITKQQLSFAHIVRANSSWHSQFDEKIRTPKNMLAGHNQGTHKYVGENCFMIVKDHKAWRMMIHKVTESRPRLDG